MQTYKELISKDIILNNIINDPSHKLHNLLPPKHKAVHDLRSNRPFN